MTKIFFYSGTQQNIGKDAAILRSAQEANVLSFR